MSPSSRSSACCRWPAGGSSFGPNPHGSQMVQKWPYSVFMILENFSLVFGVQDGVLGARVLFGIQSYVYIGPGVAFN